MQNGAHDFDWVDIDAVRWRLRDMTDKEVIEFGKACRWLMRNKQKVQSDEPWKTQIEAAKQEWRRRYPKVGKV